MATLQVKSEVLNKILKRDGFVTASAVVAYASPKKSPIHDEFEWDDAVAAAQHRLATARRMIRSTPIKSATGEKSRLVHVPPAQIEGPTAATQKREGTYKPSSVIVKSESEYNRALRELQSQVNAIQRTIQELKRAAGEEMQLLPQLQDAIQLARETIRLMHDQAA